MKADLEKKTLNIRTGDWDYIESIAKPQGFATSEVVRLLISNFVDQKRKTEKTSNDFSTLDLEIE